MTIEQAKSAINAVYEPAYANYIIKALTGERYEDENGNFVEPCEDCINRKDLIKSKFIIPENEYEKTWNDVLDSLYENAPSVQPIRPKGEWMRMIADDDDYILPRYRCYKCGFIVAEFDRSNFCPNCGAKMESEG